MLQRVSSKVCGGDHGNTLFRVTLLVIEGCCVVCGVIGGRREQAVLSEYREC